jgi:hypothetical protein
MQSGVKDPFTHYEEIAGACGEPVAERLFRLAGGTTVYVPHESALKPHSQLVRLLGAEDARIIAIAVGPGSLTLTRNAAELRRRRNAEIRQSRSTGSTNSELALRYGMTVRSIQRILAMPERGNPKC